MSTRFYVAGNWDDVYERIAVARISDPDNGPSYFSIEGHAVTADLRAALADADDEQLEHYAMTEAAQESLRNFHDEGEPMRRLVLAFDVEEATPVLDGGTRVMASVAIPSGVAAWLVDTEEAAEDVSAAAAAYRLGADDADGLAERCLDHELAWYAAVELDVVLGLS